MCETFLITLNFGNRQCHLCKISANLAGWKIFNAIYVWIKKLPGSKIVSVIYGTFCDNYTNMIFQRSGIILQKLCKFMQIYANLCKYMQIYFLSLLLHFAKIMQIYANHKNVWKNYLQPHWLTCEKYANLCKFIYHMQRSQHCRVCKNLTWGRIGGSLIHRKVSP